MTQPGNATSPNVETLKSRRRAHAVRALHLACVLAVASAHAHEVFDASGFKANRPYESALPFEHVDPLSGNLLLTFTDLVLPGNAGFDLRIQRTYNSKIFKNWETQGGALTEANWIGIGWTLHLGRVLHPFGSTPQAVEMADGSSHKLFLHADSSGDYVTREFWRYRTSGAAPQVLLPNGLVYTFGVSIDLPSGQSYHYVTKIEDPFGNVVTVSYMTGANEPRDGIKSIVQTLGPSTTRTLTFAKDASVPGLTMTYGTRKWTYAQAASDSVGFLHLKAVTPPVGPGWKFTYASAASDNPRNELKRVETPNGGVLDYTWQEVSYNLGSTVPIRSRALKTRAASGRDVTPGLWTYAFSQGAGRNQSVFVAPCGVTVYRFLGVGSSVAAPVWQIGLLAGRDVQSASGVVLESQSLSWAPSDPISFASEIVGPNVDPNIRVPLLDVQTTTRWGSTPAAGHSTHVVDNDYAAPNFNDYGRAWRTTETGPAGTRVVTRTFQYGFTPYIVDRTASVSVSSGAQSFVTTSSFAPATGFRTGEDTYGIPFSYAPSSDGRGNLASVTDGEGRVTSYTYQHGVVRNTTTGEYVVAREINPDGTLQSETRAGVTTSFSYDELMRPRTTTPPLGNGVTTSYDNTAGAWVEVSQGPNVSGGTSRVRTRLDGFGRPTGTSDAVGVQREMSYDACGRKTFDSHPVGTPAPAALPGTQYSYDALGRVSLRRNADDSTVSYVYRNGIDVDVTNERGLTTRQTWAAFGDPDELRLTSVQDAAGRTWSYAYNVLGSLTQVTPPGAGPVRRWTYFPTNLVASETHPELGTDGGGTVHFTYFGNGLLKTRREAGDATNVLTTFTYDRNNRLTQVDRPGTAYDQTFSYDVWDRRTQAQDAFVTTNFSFDAAGRLTSRQDTVDPDGVGGLGASVLKTTFTPDGNGNVARIVYPSGSTVAYAYDAENRVTGAFDSVPGGEVYAGGVVYHPSGGVTSYTAGSQIVHSTSFDPQTYRARTIDAGGLLKLNYELYDKAGNVVDLKETSRSGMNQHFAYDDVDRLIQADGPWGSGLQGLSFTYSDGGDRQTMTLRQTQTTYTYGSASRRLTSIGGAGADAFTYDARGRLKTTTSTSFTYTPNDTLETSTVGGIATTYRYDQDLLRKAKLTGSDARYYAHGSGQELLAEMCRVGGSGTLSPVRDYVLLGSQVVAALRPPAPFNVAFVAGGVSVGEGAGSVSVPVQLRGSPGQTLSAPLSVRFTTADGTAQAGFDYAAVADGLIVFPAGSASGAVMSATVAITGDLLVEPNETFTVSLTSVSCGAELGTLASQTVTILDDEASVRLGAATSSVAENGMTTPVTVVVETANNLPLANSVSVTASTADGTALAGSDYQTTSALITFIPGQPSSRVLPISILNDGLREGNQTFSVNLSGVSGGTLTSPASQTVTIVDDEPLPLVSVNATSVVEGHSGGVDAAFGVTWSVPSESEVSVAYSTVDGSAQAGLDYWAKAGTLRLAPQALSGVVRVGVQGDRLAEGAESFTLGLSNAVGGVLGAALATGTIVDDDAPGLSVVDVSVREGDVARVELRLWPATATAVDVTYTSVAGTAKPARDYVPVSGVAHFEVGQTSVIVDVPTLGDALAEGVEIFTLELSDASGAPIGSGVGSVSVADASLGVDFNLDGHTDVLWQHESGATLVWFMTGSQQSGVSVLLPNEPPDASWRVVGTGSFHAGATGQADVLWRNVDTGELRAALMEGVVRVGEPQPLVPNQTVDWNWQPVATGDFNRDGKSDVLWRHQVSGNLLVWLLDGVVRTAELPTLPAGPAGASWQVAGTGDFNLDGKTDVLFRNSVSGNFVTWLMDVATPTEVPRLSGNFLNPESMPQLTWQVVSACDFDRNGTADVLWQNAVSRKLVLWRMQGLYRQSGEFTLPPDAPPCVAPDSATCWQVVGPR